MGCVIESFAERQLKGRSVVIPKIAPFWTRLYGFFGWFADVNNFSAVIPVPEPRGLPKDVRETVASYREGRDITCVTFGPQSGGAQMHCDLDYRPSTTYRTSSDYNSDGYHG